MRKLLLVDDDADLCETLVEWFQMEGYEVDAAATGSAALSKMQAGKYDLIILDWQLPEMQGVDVCRDYRTGGGSDRILMLTGMRDAASQTAGKEAGADDFLQKPFTLDQLMSRVQKILATE